MKTPSRRLRRLRRLLLAAALFPLLAHGAETTDQQAIRRAMATTWDRPDAQVDVGPIVVVSDRALAGWTQGERGGRALLSRDAHGRWQVTACAGDGLREAKTLETTGMAPRLARQLSAEMAKAESTVPAARLAKFSTFDGMVRMDSGHDGAHPSRAAVTE